MDLVLVCVMILFFSSVSLEIVLLGRVFYRIVLYGDSIVLDGGVV
jgi:hypothetical protein